ncbi:hypothetical protein [Sphingopyxis sp. BSNA05]|nr:hypothetical protein [Sphingopyxis sp. BSNA05]
MAQHNPHGGVHFLREQFKKTAMASGTARGAKGVCIELRMKTLSLR